MSTTFNLLQWNDSPSEIPSTFTETLNSSLSYNEFSFSSTNNILSNIQAGYYLNWKTTGQITTYFLYDYENNIVGTGTSPNSPYNTTTFSFTIDVRLKNFVSIIDVSGYGPTLFYLDDFTVSVPVFVLNDSETSAVSGLPTISSSVIYQSFLNDPVNVYQDPGKSTLVGTVTFILNAGFYICNDASTALSSQNNLTLYNNYSIQAGPLAIATFITDITYTPTTNVTPS